ncbi:MAG: hypothetical protein ACFE8M_10355 [Candidatus Hermodarchaeota archaeon]
MTEAKNNTKKLNLNNFILFAEIGQIFILYFDEIKGHIPLLIFPDDSIKNNIEKMRPVKFHPIWFLNFENKNDFEHVDLIYDGKGYFAKKFQISSKREKRRAGIREKYLEVIIVIIALPKEFDFYGLDLLNTITKMIRTNYEPFFYQIIESEVLKENLIKTPEILELIKRGDSIKETIKHQIKEIWKHYIDSVRHYFSFEELKKIKNT